MDSPPARQLELKDLKRAVRETKRWQRKVEKAGRFYFLLVVAAAGIPWPYLRLIGLLAVIVLFFQKVFKYSRQHARKASINIYTIDPRDFLVDPLNYALVLKAKKVASRHKFFISWLFFSTFFGLACFASTLVDIEKAMK